MLADLALMESAICGLVVVVVGLVEICQINK